MKALQIDEAKVAAVITEVKQTIVTNNIEAEYTALISAFSESKGDTAEALKSLLQAEKEMLKELDLTLTEFAASIQFAVNEFKKMDMQGARAVASGKKQ